ncbi:MAG: AAA family ATPase [Planctomycetes bacterium]|nr:AAA family ATPase [Planctomycetota bacterium]MBL7037833.1 AAA family ATPase [Pirellulaceae bacterium]
MMTDQRVIDKVRAACDGLQSHGKLLSKERLQSFLGAFQSRFGPERLRSLDGEALLETVHNHSNRDSLVYWLEFKNDEEFPTPRFGSIAGGSALKFIIYRRKETGEWMTGSPTKQRPIPVSEAIDYARKHRDQLVKGVEVLEQFPSSAIERDYERLERQLHEIAPDVSPLAWGHKYFSLLFPDILDDFHSPVYQRFHIIKLLQLPPPGEGRYCGAIHFVELAQQLDIPLVWLTTTLNHCNAHSPYRYWRVGTGDDSERRAPWALMRDNNCAAIGWERLGDLTGICDEQKRDAVRILKGLVARHYPSDPQRIGGQSHAISRFVNTATDGDLVVAMCGKTVRGVGRIAGDYYFQPGEEFPNRRPVEWLNLDDWEFPEADAKSTFGEIRHSTANLVEIEKRIYDAIPLIATERKQVDPARGTRIPELSGIPGRIQAALERKSQVILYGPPGTGKTFWAERTARDLSAHDAFGMPFDELNAERQRKVIGDGREQAGRVRFCCFHPAYGYEDFLEGYRPEETDGRMTFVLRSGIFQRICDDAAASPNQRFYLIIDEINRGDIPRIFGELLTVLEKNKRGKAILLPLTGESFSVPSNVYVIGTMNTADRSIALLDTALRRRFGFIELMPDSSTLGDAVIDGIPLGPWLDELNRRICDHIGRDARNLQVGHSYLLEAEKPIATFPKFARIIHDDILPLLEEYCYEDFAMLERILGQGLVDGERQEIRHELFADDRHDDLVHALLAPCPEIAASPQALEAEIQEEDGADEPDDEGDDE